MYGQSSGGSTVSCHASNGSMIAPKNWTGMTWMTSRVASNSSKDSRIEWLRSRNNDDPLAERKSPVGSGAGRRTEYVTTWDPGPQDAIVDESGSADDCFSGASATAAITLATSR